MSAAIEIVRISGPGALERDFIEFPKRLYRDCPQWVPWFDLDMRKLLRRRHPFFAHASGDFFLARREGRTVGRACVVKNPSYIAQHGTACAHFYFFDLEDDPQAAEVLVQALLDWARAQGLEMLRGPMLLGGVSGSGILVDGFEHQAAMTMMPYNHPYYSRLLEGLGFRKHVDLYSMDLPPSGFRLPARVSAAGREGAAAGPLPGAAFQEQARAAAGRRPGRGALQRDPGRPPGGLPAERGGAGAGEEGPAGRRRPGAGQDPGLQGAIVGYLFAFPDLSEPLPAQQGAGWARWSCCACSPACGTATRLLINGMGILPEYQRLGGNALLYHELEQTAGSGLYRRVELVQVSERTELMLRDIETLGARIFKTHRIYEMEC